MNREPIAVVNAVRLCLLAAVTFGLSLSDVQLVASMAALEAVLTMFSRSRVTPIDGDDGGQSVLVVAAVAACVCLVLLFAFDLI